MRVNNKTRVYTVETPRAKKAEIRMAKGMNEIGAPINGNIWRIGNPERGALKVGDIVHKGEEIANLEAMKMENVIVAPFDGQIAEVCVKLNSFVIEGQTPFCPRKDITPLNKISPPAIVLIIDRVLLQQCRIQYFRSPPQSTL